MAALVYNNFDLLIERTPDGYRAGVIDSPVGQLSPLAFQLPEIIAASTDQLRLVGGAIRAFQRGAPPPDTPDLTPLDPEDFGRQLFTALFHGDLNTQLRLSIAQAKQQNASLRIRLFLNGAPELALLPWEYLFDPRDNRFLALATETSIVRYLALPQAEKPLTTALPLRILAVIADAQDVAPKLDSALERAHLEAALKDLLEMGSVEITWLEHATLAQLHKTLQDGKYHIFHFIGHGWFDETKGDGGLLFVNDHGLGRPVSAQELGTWLYDHCKTLRLAFLNACEGAHTAEGQPFSGVAQNLMQKGLPAVIAMQFPITDKAAIILAQEFYSSLANGVPVDAALTEARKAVYGQPSVMEWGTPVLFLRADEGRLFVIPDTPQPAVFSLAKYYLIAGALAVIVFAGIAGLNLPGWFPLGSEETPTVPVSAMTPLSGITPTVTTTKPVGGGQPNTATPTPLATIMTNVVDGAAYVYIPAGTLNMGTSDEEYKRWKAECDRNQKDTGGGLGCSDLYDNEQKQHQVDVPAFWIKQTEVTNVEYYQCVRNGPCTEPGRANSDWIDPNKSDYPITYVDWNQAGTYAIWVNGQLPTEAEWEMACRGVDGRRFPWGSEQPNSKQPNIELANYSNLIGEPQPVRKTRPGAYNLYDMAGNVWEWTQTAFEPNYNNQQTREARATLEARTNPNSVVKRGGAYDQSYLQIHCAYRYLSQDVKSPTGSIGFRVVLTDTASLH